MSQTFIQVNSNPTAVDASSVSVAYASAETAGDLNVVVVGWNDTVASVTSVVDDNTNVYVLAGTTAGHGLSQAIYYAKNIVLPNNSTPTVTVTFNQTASLPDVRILEYGGLDTTAPLDNWSGNFGASILADSGSVDTSSTDLIVGAGTTVTAFLGPGAGFTVRTITSSFGDLVEDTDTAQVAGSYNATGSLTSSGAWVMQGVGFSTTPVTFASPPTVASVSPSSGPDTGGTTVTITGTDFQPGAIALFGTAPGGLSGVNCAFVSGTTIVCKTPADAVGVRDVTVVNVDGQTGSASSAYTYVHITPPTFTAITPASGPTNGLAATITGSDFQNGAKVLIGGLPAGDVVVQDSGTITVTTPGLPAGTADVTVTNPDGGNVTSPAAFSYVPGSGPINYIQAGVGVNSTTAAALAVNMPNPQAAGNLNVVVVGWSDATSSVTSVADSEGNTYSPALAPNVGTGVSQVIYYAKNIAGDTTTPNQITVTFDQAAAAPDVRVLEYSGLDVSNPLDQVAGNSGTGTLADSGACTTTSPVELVVGAATVISGVTGPGAGFNLLALTYPNGDSAQHRITSAAGSCESTAPLVNANWVMESVSFKPIPPDFSLSAAPLTQTVTAGGSADYTVTVGALHSFTSAVALTCSAGLPAGATCTFVPASVTPTGTPATSTLTIGTTAATPVGTVTVTLTGTSGSLTHDTTVDLTVNAVPVPDFDLTASALTPVSVKAGSSSMSTITIAPVNAFSADVTLGCSVTPVVALPPTCAFNPAAVTGGSGTSTLSVATSPVTTASIASRAGGLYFALCLPAGLALLGMGCTSRRKRLFGVLLSAALVVGSLIFLNACGGSSSGGGGSRGTPAGTYTVTVTGTSGALTHNQTLTLTVTH